MSRQYRQGEDSVEATLIVVFLLVVALALIVLAGPSWQWGPY